MTRRQLLASAPGATPLAQAVRPRQGGAARPYPGVAYRIYARCLPDYLRRLAARAVAIRERELEKLTTAEAVRLRQRQVRETFWKLVGGRPERTPLQVRTLGGFERPAYRVEKLIYESRPGFHVPANLYIPEGARPPLPGILFQMGHSWNGKAAATYQRCCQGLAQLGFLVLAFDPMGQGERVYYPGSQAGHTRLSSADEEHTLPGRQMLLYGDTSSRLQVWDAIRSLDVLASHPLVDPKRLGSTGQSGGGTLTMLLACADDRLAAAVVCMGNTENIAAPVFDPPGATDDAEQNFVGGGPAGFDRWDLLYPLAPKPLLINVSDKDFFGTYSPNYIRNGWAEFQKLKRVYQVLGSADRLDWQSTPLAHHLALDSRLRLYRWFSRWLKGDNRPVDREPPTEPEPDSTLWVSETGSVVRSFGSKTPFTLNRERALKRSPAALDVLIGADRPPAAVRFTVLQRVRSLEGEIEAVEVPSAPGVWLPAWVFLPRMPDPSKPAFLALAASGRNRDAQEGGLYQSLAARGCLICAADVRGIGDLAPEFGRGSPGHARSHNSEEDYAWASLVLGKPLAGQRATDILALAAALRSHPACAGRTLVLAASGSLTVPALFAAALDASIDRVYLAGGLVSFDDLVQTEEYKHSFANFVPRLLLHTDLPELAASLAPRLLTLGGTVAADGRTLTPEAVARVYGSPNVRTLARAGWNLETFLGL